MRQYRIRFNINKPRGFKEILLINRNSEKINAHNN